MPTPPLAGWRTPRPGPARVCECSSFLTGSGGLASRARSGAPHLSFGRFVFLLCSALSRLGLPLSCFFVCLLSCCLAPFARLRCLPLSLVSGPGCHGPWGFVFLSSPGVLCVFFSFSFFFLLSSFVVRPRCVWVSLVSGPGCPPPWRCVLFLLLVSRFSALWALSCFSPGRWLLPCGCCPPPLLLCLAVFVADTGCFFFFPSAALLLPPCLALVGGSRRLLPPSPFLFLFVLLVSRCLVLRVLLLLLCFPAGRWLLPSGCCPPAPFCYSRFLSLPLVAPFFFLCCFASACLLGCCHCFSPSASPPPRCVRGALCCLVLPRCAALPSGILRCRVAVFRAACRAAVPRVAVWWAAARCAVFVGASVCVLCCAVGCCCVFCRVSGRAIRLGCSWCGLLSGFSLRCPVPCCAVCPWLRCCAALLRVVPPGVVLLCAVLLCCACFVPLLVLLCPLALPVALGPCALRRCVFCGVPPRCVLCVVCVLSWRVGACCCSPLCFLLCVSWGVVLCVPCPLRFVRCCALLCWCACVVLLVWCVLLLAPDDVVRCCVLCCFFRCSVVRCWVWWPLVVCWWRVTVSVSLSGRLVCFPVVGAVCSCALLPCVVFCGAVLSPGAVLSCSAVVFRCCFCLLCPPVACCAAPCCAVLCCWLYVLFFARRWRLCAVVPFTSLPARTKRIDYHPVLPRAGLCVVGSRR